MRISHIQDSLDLADRTFNPASTETSGAFNSVYYSKFSRTAREQQRFTSRMLLVLSDIMAIAIVLAIVVLSVRSARSTQASPVEWLRGPALLAFVLIGLGLVGVLGLRQHYRRHMATLAAMPQIVSASLGAAVATSLLLLATDAPPSTRWLPLVWLAMPLAIPLVRAGMAPLLRRYQWRQERTLIACGDEIFDPLYNALCSDGARRYDIVGSLRPETLLQQVADAPDSGDAAITPLRLLLDSHGADLLVLALRGSDADTQAGLLRVLANETVPYAIVPDLAGLPVIGCRTQGFLSHSVMMMIYDNDLANPLRRWIKSALDRGLAIAVGLFILPVLLVVAGLVAIDGGAVFFSHRRLGQNGRSFGCLKFRTMVQDGDAVLARLLASDPAAAAEWEETRKLRRDPRVTPIGRFLRATSLDELPQLLNVVRGDMSLVGPRPIVRAEIVRYGSDIEYYYRIKPGITGLWQVSGRSDTSYEQRVQLDVWYAKNWSLWHDILILFKTVPALLKREGAV